MADDLLVDNALPSQFPREKFWLGRQAVKKECGTIKN